MARTGLILLTLALLFAVAVFAKTKCGMLSLDYDDYTMAGIVGLVAEREVSGVAATAAAVAATVAAAAVAATAAAVAATVAAAATAAAVAATAAAAAVAAAAAAAAGLTPPLQLLLQEYCRPPQQVLCSILNVLDISTKFFLFQEAEWLRPSVLN